MKTKRSPQPKPRTGLLFDGDSTSIQILEALTKGPISRRDLYASLTATDGAKRAALFRLRDLGLIEVMVRILPKGQDTLERHRLSQAGYKSNGQLVPDAAAVRALVEGMAGWRVG